MKKLAIYLLLFFANHAFGQYYLRGEIKDEKNVGLQNARIFLHSARAVYFSGTYGSFGITVPSLYDSLTITLDGYESRSMKVRADQWQNIVMKISASRVSTVKHRLISITKDLKQTSKYNWFTADETYFQLVENNFVNAAAYPNTGYSLNVNKASYSNVRRFLNMGSNVPPDAVRIEEMVNYFNLCYNEPQKGDVFRLSSQLTSCPWEDQKQLLFINVSARKLVLDKVPPCNFVFLIDVSGSMDMPNRLPLLKAAFQMFVKNLRTEDKVSIITYGGSVGIWLEPTSGEKKKEILESIESLTAAGDTPGESAIRAAYRLAERTFIKGGNNRVILATDGDFNVGENTEKGLEELITKQRQTGIYLTCLGVGMGNFKDSKLQTLAKKGNGNYAYLDDIREAEKVLVKELTQTFYAVADDVFMNVRFNASMVKQYRLIGFDNKKEAVIDSTSDIEGGEVGSGNSTLAVFEIIPTQQNLLTKNTSLADDLASLSLQYIPWSDTTRRELTFRINNNYLPVDSIHKELRFATAVTMLGLKLKQSPFVSPKLDWPFLKTFAASSINAQDYLQVEFLKLITEAEKIYEVKKKKLRIKR